MSNKSHRYNRKVHFWGSLLCAIPVVIIVVSGVLLLLKKQSDWIQPPTIKGHKGVPSLSYAQILSRSQSVTQAGITGWQDIKRLDVRPSKGVIKVQANNRWEIQLDQQTGEVLHVAYRRSDLIEEIHDGSFFHDRIKLWLFLPAALVLLTLWGTGIYLLTITLLARRRKRLRLSSR